MSEQTLTTPVTSSALEEVRAWFFDDYLPTWVTAGASGASATFIGQYWTAPLWVSNGQQAGVLPTEAEVVGFLDGMQTRLRENGYTHTVVPDRRVTVFNEVGASVEVIWSRRREDESEVERLAVNFSCMKLTDGWRVVAIQGNPTAELTLAGSWQTLLGEAAGK